MHNENKALNPTAVVKISVITKGGDMAFAWLKLCNTEYENPMFIILY